jgi:hypothetical protein
MLIYFTAIWNILRPFGIFYEHLVPFVFILVHFVPVLVLITKKSGNPADACRIKNICSVPMST